MSDLGHRPFRVRDVSRASCIWWDPCGLLCLSVLYSVFVCVAGAVNAFAFVSTEGLFELVEKFLYNSLVVLCLACHTRCMTTNPGIAKDFLDQDLQTEMREEFHRLCADGVPPEEAAYCQGSAVQVSGEPRSKWWCTTCDTFRPSGAHHCKTCGRCVLEMDHHCPWVNNCIGLQNHKYFLLFVAYAWIACLWSFIRLSHALLNVPDVDQYMAGSMEMEMAGSDGSRLLHQSAMAQLLCMGSALACFLFWLFATMMGCDQWTFLEEGYGMVDQKLQSKQPRCSAEALSISRSITRELAKVLGGGGTFNISWMLPITSAKVQEALIAKVECASRISARTS
mmetsp:Transcript_14619/g.27443  ORF Transcript_14619/g.27443 Transcript_14619/m.27443 type:complete len:338 (+) Transcript_14619:52-1065(+)